jgi:hypothetical protein
MTSAIAVGLNCIFIILYPAELYCPVGQEYGEIEEARIAADVVHGVA